MFIQWQVKVMQSLETVSWKKKIKCITLAFHWNKRSLRRLSYARILYDPKRRATITDTPLIQHMFELIGEICLGGCCLSPHLPWEKGSLVPKQPCLFLSSVDQSGVLQVTIGERLQVFGGSNSISVFLGLILTFLLKPRSHTVKDVSSMN